MSHSCYSNLKRVSGKSTSSSFAIKKALEASIECLKNLLVGQGKLGSNLIRHIILVEHM